MEYARENLNKWLASRAVDEASKAELSAIADNDEEVKSRFCAPLSFGTAGLRGVLGAGLNRMNIYTVRQATAGLAKYILTFGKEACDRGVAVAYDSRIMSREFSETVCRVLAAYGVRSYLFDELRPTPELSFAIRDLHCISGVNVTASHNPKQYNGYKVYWSDGAQIGPEQADAVSRYIRETDLFTGAKELTSAEAKPFITVLGREYDEKYLAEVLKQVQDKEVIRRGAQMKIIYTPFHGAGYRLVPEVLKRAGFENLDFVREQMVTDGTFPTVKSPNPENKEGFAIAMEMARENGADLIVGTDPDCDRMGVVVRRKDGEFTALTGNQTGMILLDYILSTRVRNGTLPKDGCVVKSLVSTQMASAICEAFSVKLYNVLTGFKFIGEKMEQFKATGKGTFLFGFEESYGYLVGDYARDKDGAVASLLACEAAAYYAQKGMTLYDALQSLYEKYGTFTEKTANLLMEGADGPERMKALTNRLRSEKPTEVAGVRVTEIRDYMTGIDGLPAADVLSYVFEDGSVVIVRPSGTEPKIKLYVMTSGKSRAESDRRNEALEAAFRIICA